MACRAEFPRILNPCQACGLPKLGHRCPASGPDWCLAGVRAPFSYAPPLDQILNDLKFRRQRSLGRALGLVFVQWIEKGLMAGLAGRSQNVDAIVAVPLHASRLRERSFNQADEIARTIARSLNLPQLVRGIVRCTPTAPQSKLHRRARQSNLSGAFAVRRDLSGLRVGLVDDVMTTGATMNELAACLHFAGAARVEAWAVARTI